MGGSESPKDEPRGGFLSPCSGVGGAARHAPRSRKAPGAGPGYLCPRRRHRPSRWVAIHALARGRLVAGAEGSGGGVGVGVGAEVVAGAMGGETDVAGTTRGGAGGGAGSAGRVAV